MKSALLNAGKIDGSFNLAMVLPAAELYVDKDNCLHAVCATNCWQDSQAGIYARQWSVYCGGVAAVICHAVVNNLHTFGFLFVSGFESLCFVVQ